MRNEHEHTFYKEEQNSGISVWDGKNLAGRRVAKKKKGT
jgi:hypothetical protein